MNLEWFAVDREGAIGYFTKGSWGAFPRSVAESEEDWNRVCDYFWADLGRTTTGHPDERGLERVRALGFVGEASEGEALGEYLQEPREMASRGLFCFDSFESTLAPCGYFRIVAPNQIVTIDSLPEQVRSIVARTRLVNTSFRIDDEVCAKIVEEIRFQPARRVATAAEAPPSNSIHEAAAYGLTEQVAQLLRTDRCSVESCDAHRNQPIHIAVREAQREIVELILENGGDVNAIGNFGQTPLHFAAQYDWNFEVLDTLLARSPNVDHLDESGRSPIQVAAHFRLHEVLNALLEYRGGLSLDDAVFLNQAEQVRHLLSGQEGNPSEIIRLLGVAVRSNAIASASVLLSLASEITDADRRSFIQIARAHGNGEMIALLET